MIWRGSATGISVNGCGLNCKMSVIYAWVDPLLGFERLTSSSVSALCEIISNYKFFVPIFPFRVCYLDYKEKFFEFRFCLLCKTSRSKILRVFHCNFLLLFCHCHLINYSIIIVHFIVFIFWKALLVLL